MLTVTHAKTHVQRDTCRGTHVPRDAHAIEKLMQGFRCGFLCSKSNSFLDFPFTLF